MGLERLRHLELLANPACSDNYGTHRAIANWINEFTTTVRENLIAMAKDQRSPDKPINNDTFGTPYMQHTDFGNEDLDIPIS